MAIITKKICQNGNTYIYFSNGKIKTIRKNGIISWKTKRIFKTKKTTKDLNLRSFFFRKGKKNVK